MSNVILNAHAKREFVNYFVGITQMNREWSEIQFGWMWAVKIGKKWLGRVLGTIVMNTSSVVELS